METEYMGVGDRETQVRVQAPVTYQPCHQRQVTAVTKVTEVSFYSSMNIRNYIPIWHNYYGDFMR